MNGSAPGSYKILEELGAARRLRLVPFAGALFLASLAGAAALASPGPWPEQQPGNTGVSARFRGVSAASDDVVWASGTDGTVVRTIDGGTTWEAFTVAGAESLDLRDIDAFDENIAYALSIGSGADSRIFKTADGGSSWETQFVNEEPQGFFDAMSFWDAERGVAVSDSIEGEFYVLRTEDGGAHWTRVPPAGLPPALAGEGYFAASGTNVTTWGADHVWFGTGASDRARVARSTDGGTTWEIVDTPLAAGPTAGIYSIAFRDADHGVIVGGDYRLEEEAIDNAAITSDGGRTWQIVEGLSGFRSAVAHVTDSSRPSWVAIGPKGADISRDDGRTWTPLASPSGMHTLSFAPGSVAGWAAGNDGRVTRFGPDRRPVR